MQDLGKRWSDVLTNLLQKGLLPCNGDLVSATGPVLIAGPPGTGKSSLAEYLLGKGEVIRVICHRKQSLRDLVGSTQIRGGDTCTVVAAAARAMQDGKLLILDEIDQHSPDTRSFIHALLDDPRIAMAQLPDGQTIRPAAGYGVIATTNAHPSSLPPALLDRFGVFLPALVPSAGLLDSFNGGERKLLENFYDREAGSWEAWSGQISARRMAAFDRLKNAGVDTEEAALLSFGDAGNDVVNSIATSDISSY